MLPASDDRQLYMQLEKRLHARDSVRSHIEVRMGGRLPYLHSRVGDLELDVSGKSLTSGEWRQGNEGTSDNRQPFSLSARQNDHPKWPRGTVDSR